MTTADADRAPASARPSREPKWTNHVEPVEPVADRRLTGEHWWDPDRIAHVEDAPRFCPSCGAVADGKGTIAVEYWEGDRRVYHLRCGRCAWSGDVTRVDRMIGIEAPD